MQLNYVDISSLSQTMTPEETKLYTAVKKGLYNEAKKIISDTPSFTRAFYTKYVTTMEGGVLVHELLWQIFLKTTGITLDDCNYLMKNLLNKTVLKIGAVYEKIASIGYKYTEQDILFYTSLSYMHYDNDGYLQTLETMLTHYSHDILHLFTPSLIQANTFNNFMRGFMQLLNMYNRVGFVFTSEVGTLFYKKYHSFKENTLNEFIQWLCKQKFVPDDSTILAACDFHDYPMLVWILTNFKLPCTIAHFKQLCAYRGDIKCNATMIDLLIQHGLQLTVNDIAGIVPKHMYVNDIERFIKTDADRELLKKVCFEHKMFKYPTVCGITPETAQMYELCCSNRSAFTDVKALVKNGCAPDTTALMFAARNRYQKKLVSYLIDLVPPNKECFAALCDTFDASRGTISKMAIKLGLKN